jgi:hypothetical protein
MATIIADYGTGAGQIPPTGNDNFPTLAKVLRDIADDIGARSAIVAPAAAEAVGANPTKAEFDIVVTLVNEIRTKLLTAVKNLVRKEEATALLEILLRLKGNLLELINTTGDILLGQELVPAPVLRSRKIKDFKDEVTIFKDFKDIRVQIKIENKGNQLFDLHIIATEKSTAKVLKNLRVTLLKDSLELESYLADSGKVIFEHVALGKYTVALSDIDNQLASILLDIKI